MTDSGDAAAGYNGRTETQAGQPPADRETAARLDEAVRLWNGTGCR